MIMAKKFQIDQRSYERLSSDGGGICLSCGEITDTGVEPDAKGYKCSQCSERKLTGLEQALIMGRITLRAETGETLDDTFVDDDDEDEEDELDEYDDDEFDDEDEDEDEFDDDLETISSHNRLRGRFGT
jgi:hypothetical protein